MIEVILLLWIVGVSLVTWALLEKRPRITHGSAAWGEPPAELLRAAQPGNVYIGQWDTQAVLLSREAAAQHGVILGGSGTGKSRGYFLPNAARAGAMRTSLICTDPKGELWQYTSGFHERATRFDPADPQRSACFNWVPLCKDARLSELCARAIIESGQTTHTDQAWLDLETAFLSALFSHAATTEAPTPLTAYKLFTCQPQPALIEQLLASPSRVAREQAQVFLQTQERMRGSIVPVVAARLQFLRDDSVMRFTSASTKPPDFSDLRKKPGAVYYCIREQDIARLRPLTSVFFSVLLEQLGSGEKGDVPVVLLLDEFANIGTIPGFETIISVARGRGLALWLGIQSLSQLEARYGKANAQTILTNCATKIALHGLDVVSAKYISDALGESTVSATRRSSAHFLGLVPSPTVTLGDLEHRRPLLTPDEVRRLASNRAIAIVSNYQVMQLEKPLYLSPQYEKLTAGRQPLGEALALSFEAEESATSDGSKKAHRAEGKQHRDEPPEFPKGLEEILLGEWESDCR